jgi:hypothetical protein
VALSTDYYPLTSHQPWPTRHRTSVARFPRPLCCWLKLVCVFRISIPEDAELLLDTAGAFPLVLAFFGALPAVGVGVRAKEPRETNVRALTRVIIFSFPFGWRHCHQPERLAADLKVSSKSAEMVRPSLPGGGWEGWMGRLWCARRSGEPQGHIWRFREFRTCTCNVHVGEKGTYRHRARQEGECACL